MSPTQNLKEAEDAAQAVAGATIAAARAERRAYLREQFFPGYSSRLDLTRLSGPELKLVAANAGKKKRVAVPKKKKGAPASGCNQDAVDYVLGALADYSPSDVEALRARIKAESTFRSLPREQRYEGP